MIDLPGIFEYIHQFIAQSFQLRSSSINFCDFGPPRIDTFPFESDSGTMRKVLNWGVVPLNLK